MAQMSYDEVVKLIENLSTLEMLQLLDHLKENVKRAQANAEAEENEVDE